MKNVNMVEFLVELQKSHGVRVFLTDEGLRVFLELMAAQNDDSETVQKVG